MAEMTTGREGEMPVSWSLQAWLVRKGIGQLLERGCVRGRPGVPPHTLSCSLDYVHQQMGEGVKQSRGSW